MIKPEITCKNVVGYEDLYVVFCDGGVARRGSLDNLKPGVDPRYGHLHVSLCRNGEGITTSVHRIVALAFLGKEPVGKPYVCHKDGDPTNNHVENLYWGTPEQNCADAKKHGTSNVGSRNGSAKLTEDQVRNIHALILEGFSCSEIADSYDVHSETIRSIKSGKSWSHVTDVTKTNSVVLSDTPQLIKGDCFIDDRGVLGYVNDMNFFGIKRFYHIHHNDSGMIRAWHGHRQEGKFVYVPYGMFLVGVVNMKTEKMYKYVLSSIKPMFLWIPSGYANGFKNLRSDSGIMFFSTSTTEESTGDDIRFEWNKWNIWQEDYR